MNGGVQDCYVEFLRQCDLSSDKESYKRATLERKGKAG